MELCAGSMDQCFLPDDDPRKFRGPLPSKQAVVYQLADGLQFLHYSNGLHTFHGSIKPSKVLITRGPHPRIKISDMGLTEHSSSIEDRNPCLPPEFKPTVSGGSEKAVGTRKGDIYAVGCVMYFYLSDGCHLSSSIANAGEHDQISVFGELTHRTL